MFRISERTHAGLILMTSLAEAKDGEFLTLKDVAARWRLSDGYLEEIASSLRAAGLIVGRTGPKGGYQLAKTPAEITTEDVVTAIEGPIALVGCQATGVACPVEHGCTSKKMWGALQEKILASLRSTTLAEMAK